MPSVSVIVVSRDRPNLLQRLNRALDQQSLQGFDKVFVTNTGREAELPDDCVIVDFKDANISAARNAGIRAAMGEIVAFCDDDAVPEPEWLARITAPFADPAVALSGGFVLGRNGIDLQSRPHLVNGAAEEAGPVQESGLCCPPAGFALTAVGTNAAFRRKALREIGGFDEAFRYYLDETDAAWRLQAGGWQAAVVPGAVVHHSFAANLTRSKNRAPISFFEIASSKAVFLRKHFAGSHAAAIESFRRQNMARAHQAFSLGLLGGNDVARLRHSFDEGLAAGAARDSGKRFEIGTATAKAEPVVPRPVERAAICGRGSNVDQLLGAARKIAGKSAIAAVLAYSTSAMPSKVHYTSDGIWLHSGGIFGRIHRQDTPFKFRTRKARSALELERIGDQRTFTTVESL